MTVNRWMVIKGYKLNTKEWLQRRNVSEVNWPLFRYLNYIALNYDLIFANEFTSDLYKIDNQNY